MDVADDTTNGDISSEIAVAQSDVNLFDGDLPIGSTATDAAGVLTFTTDITAAAQSDASSSDRGSLLGSAETDAAGTWGFTPVTLANGTYSFTATGTDWSIGTTAPSSPVFMTVDTAAQSIGTTAPSSPVFMTVDTAAQSPLTVDMARPVTVAAGATVEIDGASAQSIIFAGTTGTVKLDDALAFSGQVSGLTGSDALDLADVSYGANTTATFLGNVNGGTLTVTDGTDTARIALVGDYLHSGWTLSSDGHGGTVVVDPPLYPNATNTGVPAGVKLTPYTGSLTLSTPGQVVSGLIISGGVNITASNVTLENCIIEMPSSGGWDIGVAGGLTGVVIQNCEIIGSGLSGQLGTYGIYVEGDSQVTINADNIHDVGTGVTVSDGQIIVENSYIHDLNAGAGTHYNGISYFGGGGASFSLLIQNNSIINQRTYKPMR